MKKFLMLFLFIVLSFSMFSQNPSKIYEVKGYLMGLGYTVDDDNVWQQSITQGDYFYCYKRFSPNLNYIIVAFSEDDDVKDVDVYIYNSDDTVFKKDTDTESVAIIYYVPSVDITRKCIVKNYRSNTPYYASKCWLVVAYK